MSDEMKARLRIVLYGLIVVTIAVFVVSLVGQVVAFNLALPALKDAVAATQGIDVADVDVPMPIGGMLLRSVLFTLGVAVLSVIVYFAYKEVLKRAVAAGAESESGGE